MRLNIQMVLKKYIIGQKFGVKTGWHIGNRLMKTKLEMCHAILLLMAKPFFTCIANKENVFTLHSPYAE